MSPNSPTEDHRQPAAAAVKTFLKDARWKPEILEESLDFTAYQVTFGDDYPVVGCVIELHADQQQFVSYLLLEPEVPASRKTAAAEFVARANYGMKIGNFEIDLEGGAVRYKSSLCYAGAELSKVLVYDAVFTAIESVKPYSEAFLAVVRDGKNPRDAVAEVDG